MLFLAAVPCCSFDFCSDGQANAANADSHNEEGSDCGNCSPFFSCEGCATATISSTVNLPGNLPIEQLAIFTFYIPSQLPVMDFDVWQPPRLTSFFLKV